MEERTFVRVLNGMNHAANQLKVRPSTLPKYKPGRYGALPLSNHSSSLVPPPLGRVSFVRVFNSNRAGSFSGSSKRASGRPRSRFFNATFTANANEVLAVASRLASMADPEIRERYHQLVDKSIESTLTALERFEMERIELRLDAEDRDPEIEANDRKWELERAKLLESIEDLLIKLKK